MNTKSDPILIVGGPTASGKSALALDLASHLGGVVINADSMQVYQELRILSARPTRADEDRVELSYEAASQCATLARRQIHVV